MHSICNAKTNKKLESFKSFTVQTFLLHEIGFPHDLCLNRIMLGSGVYNEHKLKTFNEVQFYTLQFNPLTSKPNNKKNTLNKRQ